MDPAEAEPYGRDCKGDEGEGREGSRYSHDATHKLYDEKRNTDRPVEADGGGIWAAQGEGIVPIHTTTYILHTCKQGGRVSHDVYPLWFGPVGVLRFPFTRRG